MTVAEREELVQLRRKVREMEETIEALGKEPTVSANLKSKQPAAEAREVGRAPWLPGRRAFKPAAPGGKAA
ncbi:hypothetical protein AB0K53_15495 [Streptomyces tuirus]|uniref:hypothetical protein n=1 Tax=Streptomyces tuirus TaxID=68278 RepID=UPI0034355E26